MNPQMNSELTIAEVQAMIAKLETDISAQLSAFRAATGLIVHSVPVEERGSTVVARVKVQIPGV